MVHVSRCPVGQRGRPSKEFTIDGKPQIYCHGYMDAMIEEPLPECSACKDFIDGVQCRQDFEYWKGRSFTNGKYSH